MAEAQQSDDREAALVEAMLGVVEQTHGPLDEAAREQLREGLKRTRAAAAALYAYPLSNADEPGTVFHPLRAD
ncbi:MAG TPA: AtzG-like protein [Dehalococcoidia bacterium]|nr:AtzG-like protein [Dehalococcoidia bacterium]